MQRDGYRCQAQPRLLARLDISAPVTCGGMLDVHEVIPRSVWPGGELVEANCVTVCRRHHDWIGDHPALAREVGLHAFSWQKREVIEDAAAVDQDD